MRRCSSEIAHIDLPDVDKGLRFCAPIASEFLDACAQIQGISFCANSDYCRWRETASIARLKEILSGDPKYVGLLGAWRPIYRHGDSNTHVSYMAGGLGWGACGGWRQGWVGRGGGALNPEPRAQPYRNDAAVIMKTQSIRAPDAG